MGSWVPNGVKRILDDFLAARTHYISFHTGDPGTERRERVHRSTTSPE